MTAATDSTTQRTGWSTPTTINSSEMPTLMNMNGSLELVGKGLPLKNNYNKKKKIYHCTEIPEKSLIMQ